MPPRAPEPTQATIHHGREGAEEHRVEVGGEGRGQDKQRRGGEGAAKSHGGVDVRGDYQGPEDVRRKYEKGRECIGEGGVLGGCGEGRGVWGRDGEGAVGEVRVVPGEESGRVDEEEGGAGDEGGVAKIDAPGEWRRGLGRVVRLVANRPAGEADRG